MTALITSSIVPVLVEKNIRDQSQKSGTRLSQIV